MYAYKKHRHITINISMSSMKDKNTINILVAAGGTGGHLFPALAVAKEIEKTSEKEVKLFFTGRPDKIEAEKIPALGYPFIPMNISGLVKKFSFGTLLLPLKIWSSTRKIKKLIKEKKLTLSLLQGLISVTLRELHLPLRVLLYSF